MLKLHSQANSKDSASGSGSAQASAAGSHFSRAYVRLLITEVQSVLASAGLASAAKQADQLLQACRPDADAQALQQLMQSTVRSSQVHIDSASHSYKPSCVHHMYCHTGAANSIKQFAHSIQHVTCW